MRLAIMQPYFWPYLGYFQLIHSADIFVIYDDIQFTKGGWINRNRILLNGTDCFVTLPLKNASGYLDIKERQLVPDFNVEADALLRRLKGAYRKAPFFTEGMEFAEATLSSPRDNLFSFLHETVLETLKRLTLDRKVVVSSSLAIDRTLAGESRVLQFCKVLGADEYINPPGGRHLYSRDAFRERGVELYFIDPAIKVYQQAHRSEFLPNLSIMDMLMAVGWNGIRQRLIDYRVELA